MYRVTCICTINFSVMHHPFIYWQRKLLNLLTETKTLRTIYSCELILVHSSFFHFNGWFTLFSIFWLNLCFRITHHYFLSPKSCQPKSLEFSKRSALHCIQNHKYKESMVFISWARSCALNNHELNSVLMIVELVMKELELSMNRENSTAKSIMLHRVNALHKEMLVTYTKQNRRGILVLCGCLWSNDVYKNKCIYGCSWNFPHPNFFNGYSRKDMVIVCLN